MPFEWYLQVEKDLSPTWFFIPFKGRPGDKVSVVMRTDAPVHMTSQIFPNGSPG